MRTSREIQRSRKAFVTVYMVFTLLILIPIVGLAIDFSVLYNVKARIQQACDAGAIGAGSMVQRSTDVTDPVQNALLQDAVTRFFNANLKPVPWNAVQTAYDRTITQDTTTKVRTIYVRATYQVPMLFMRVLGISTSTVAAQAYAKIRFVNLMIVVDRSGSVQRTGGAKPNQQIIKEQLTQFVATAGSSIFVDGRDVVGLLSFGGTYKLDFAPGSDFQTRAPNIGAAIGTFNPVTLASTGLFFDTNSSTNTGEGLYQAWYQLAQLNQTGSLNVILLITDGRPSAFTGSFTPASSSRCTDKVGPISGIVTSSVGIPFPPPTNRGTSGVFLVTPSCSTAGCEPNQFVTTHAAGCQYYVDEVAAGTDSNLKAQAASRFSADLPVIPTNVGPLDHITGPNLPFIRTFPSTTGYPHPPSTGGGTATNDPQDLRYTAINYADNVATAIRTDPTYKPVIYAIGLNFDTAAYPTEEPLDADWLARVANDQNYRSALKPAGVFQVNQTAGKFYLVTYLGLGAALRDITSQILRLSQN
jgi:hypothetical protein